MTPRERADVALAQAIMTPLSEDGAIMLLQALMAESVRVDPPWPMARIFMLEGSRMVVRGIIFEKIDAEGAMASLAALPPGTVISWETFDPFLWASTTMMWVRRSSNLDAIVDARNPVLWPTPSKLRPKPKLRLLRGGVE